MDGAAKMCKAKRLANRVTINSNADGIVREKPGSTIQCHTPPPEQEYDPFSSEGEANVLKWRSSTKIVPVDNIKTASQPRLDGRERIGDEVVQSQTENGAISMAQSCVWSGGLEGVVEQVFGLGEEEADVWGAWGWYGWVRGRMKVETV